MTQLQTIQKTREPTLDEQIAQATAMRDKLAEAAVEVEAEAERWRISFEREPTAEAHTNAAVFSQRAVLARAAVGTFENDKLTPLVGAKRKATDAIERAALAEKLDWTKAEKLMARIEAAVTGCRKEVTDATAELAAFLLTRLDDGRRASELGLSIQPEKLTRLVMAMNDRVGAAAKDAYGNPQVALMVSDHGTGQVIRIEAHGVLNVNRRVL